MEGFWPQLPLKIPASQGTSIWWDISWWVFQIVVMVSMVWLLTRWAMAADRRREQQNQDYKAPAPSDERPLDV